VLVGFMKYAIEIDTRVYQKVPGLALLTKKYITYLSLNTVSFEIVTLHSNRPATAFLPLLNAASKLFCVSESITFYDSHWILATV
jgi:hypothetical protein